MATDKRTRLLTHQSIGGISLYVTRNRHRHTSGSSGPFTSNDVSIRAAHRQRQAARNSGLLRSAVLCIRTGNARSSQIEATQSESSPTERLGDRSKSSVKAGYGICRVKSMQHLMGRRATAQGVPVHCCIDLTRYEYRYNRGAAGKEAFFPGLPSGER